MKRLFCWVIALFVFAVVLFPATTYADEFDLQRPGDVKASWDDRSTITVTAKAPNEDKTNTYHFSDKNLDSTWHFVDNSCSFNYPGDTFVTKTSAIGISDDNDDSKWMVPNSYNASGSKNDGDGVIEKLDGGRGYLSLLQNRTGVGVADLCFIKYGRLVSGGGAPTKYRADGAKISIDKKKNRFANFIIPKNSGFLDIGNGNKIAKSIIRSDGNGDWRFKLCDVNDDPRCAELNRDMKADYVWLRTSDNETCDDRLTFNDGQWENADGKKLPKGILYHLEGQGCKEVKKEAAYLKSPLHEPSESHNTAVEQTTGGGPTSDDASCEASGFSLSWIFCPVINALGDTMDGIFASFIKPLLDTPGVDVSGDSEIRQVWDQMRLFGNIILVIAMLVIVFGQAIGGGLIDAYSAKKILPRLLVAAVLINLSIYIVAVLVDVTNLLGRGLNSLIIAPFSGGGGADPKFHIGNLGAGLGIGAIVGTGAALWALKDALLQILLIFVLIPGVLTFLGILFTLILRMGIIQFLIIVSPVAFALYCLPNTERYYKQWWSLLFKTAMVYPIVAVIFAVADVLILSLDQAGGGPFSDIVQIVLMIIPLFLIPFAFKLSGGAMASIYGTLSGIGKKASEGIKGNPNDPDSLRRRSTAKLSSRAMQRGLSPAQLGSFLDPRQVTKGGMKRAKAYRSSVVTAGTTMARKQLESTGRWGATGAVDSNVAGVLARHRSGHEARQALDNWEAAQKAAGADPTELSRQVAQKRAAIATAETFGFTPEAREAALMNPYHVKFEMEEGENGWQEATSIMKDISNGDPYKYRAMMDEFQAVAKGPAQRADLAGNVDGNDAYDVDKASGSQSLYQLLNGHPKGTKGLIKEHLARINNPSASPEERELSAIFLHEMKQASTKNQGTGANQKEINDAVPVIDQAYEAYVSEMAARQMATSAVPIASRQSAEVTRPDPANPGTTVTTREPQYKPLATDQERREEAAKRIDADIGSKSRAYVQPDPNHMEENN